MDDKRFYFIKEQYFKDFPDENLMKNKELFNGDLHNRACFYTFKDNKMGLDWMVPISSQVDKFQLIYDAKVRKHKECDTIRFGYVLGEKRAFLIQNMCPVIDKYIDNQYIDTVTGEPVTVNSKMAEDIERRARKILEIERQGHNYIFPNVLEIEKNLLQQVREQMKGVDVSSQIPNIEDDERLTVAQKYQKCLKECNKRFPGYCHNETVDKGIAIALLRQNQLAKDEVKEAIEECSPCSPIRNNDARQYSKKIVDSALREVRMASKEHGLKR